MDPGFIEQYAIFSREQDHAQKTSSGGDGQMVDVLADVEFQKSYRCVHSLVYGASTVTIIASEAKY